MSRSCLNDLFGSTGNVDFRYSEQTLLLTLPVYSHFWCIHTSGALTLPVYSDFQRTHTSDAFALPVYSHFWHTHTSGVLTLRSQFTTFPNRKSTPENAKLSDPHTETFTKTDFTDATMSEEEMMAVDPALVVAAIGSQYDRGTEEEREANLEYAESELSELIDTKMEEIAKSFAEKQGGKKEKQRKEKNTSRPNFPRADPSKWVEQSTQEFFRRDNGNRDEDVFNMPAK